MSIITIADFKGEQNVAQSNNPGVRENLQGFIDKYEPKFLAMLLGSALAKEFVTGLVLVPVVPATDPVTYVPIDPKWLYLRDDTTLKAMLVDYVYYWYIRDQVTFTSGTGEVKAKNENSSAASSVGKQVMAWNEMADMAREFTLDLAVYPNYSKPYTHWVYGYGYYSHSIPDIFLHINSLNI
jgi:hypothetical protein